MNNRYYLGVMAAYLLGLNLAVAQAPAYPGGAMASSSSQLLAPSRSEPYPVPDLTPVVPEQPRPVDPDRFDYLTYGRPCNCCGPVGKDGLVSWEIFSRHGVSVPLGGYYFAKTLDAGYMLQGGGRTLFFEANHQKAWVVELGIASVWWNVITPQEITVSNPPRVEINPITRERTVIPVPDSQVTPSGMNQTYVHASLGQEFYLTGPAADCSVGESVWRVGYDVGGRWGNAKVVYYDAPHGKDIVGGPFLALHTDIEFPFKSCLFQIGIRNEFGYIWSDVLQRRNNSDVFMMNVLANIAVRF